MFRQVYNAVDGEVQLRCAVPSGLMGKFDVPGRGLRPLGYRERLMLGYHNGRLAGHMGRERTME